MADGNQNHHGNHRQESSHGEAAKWREQLAKCWLSENGRSETHKSKSEKRKKDHQITPAPIWTEVVRRASATLHTTIMWSYIADFLFGLKGKMNSNVVLVVERGWRGSLRERNYFFSLFLTIFCCLMRLLSLRKRIFVIN
jgi:hypothetical protein